MDQKKIGKYIADKRRDLGITQMQLAEKLNMSNKSVSKWERGVCLPDVSKYTELCEVLGISLNEFLAGEDLTEKEIVPKSEETIINIATDSKRSRRRAIVLMIIMVISTLFVSTVIVDFINNKESFLNRHCIIPLEEDSPEVQSALLFTDKNTVLYRFYVKEAYDRMKIDCHWYKDGYLTDSNCLLDYESSGNHFGEGIVAIIDDEKSGKLEAKVLLEGKDHEYGSVDEDSDVFRLPLEGRGFNDWQATYTRQMIVPQNKIPISPMGNGTAILLLIYDDGPTEVETELLEQTEFWPQLRDYCPEIEKYDHAAFITVKTWAKGTVPKIWP